MELEFNNIAALHWLWAVAGLVGMLWIGARLRRGDLAGFTTPALHGQLVRDSGGARRAWRSVFLLGSAALMVVALLDPRWGATYRQVERRGIDLYFVLDVSRSMLAEDATPNRLGRAKQFIRDLVDASSGDRIGLITFAGVATVQCPLTLDHGAFDLILDTVQAQSAARGGSLLGDALRLAGDSFTDGTPDSKAIIVLSDGEDHGSFPLQAAEALTAELPVPVFTIGIGDSDQGARIPVVTDQGRQFLVYGGEQVWSKMQPQTLRDIALAAGGAFIPAGTATVDMARVYEEWIQPRARRDFESATIRRLQPQYQWFAAGALACLVLATIMSSGPVGPERNDSEGSTT